MLHLSGRAILALGGVGNDCIKINSASGQAATARIAEDDSNDTVEANAPLNIPRYSSNGIGRLYPVKATLAHHYDGTVTVQF